MKATSVFGALPIILNHLGFHLAMFIATWYVPQIEKPESFKDLSLQDCIEQFKIMHGVCFLICLSQRVMEVVVPDKKFIREMFTLAGFTYYMFVLMRGAQIIQVYYFPINDNGTDVQMEQLYFINNELFVLAGVLICVILYLITNYIFYIRFTFTDARTDELMDVLGKNFWNARIYINQGLVIIMTALNIRMPFISARQTDTEINLLWATLIMGIGGAVSFYYILLVTMLGKGTKCKVMIWLILDAIWFIIAPIGLLIYSCIVMGQGNIQCATLICFVLSICVIFMSIFLNYMSIEIFISLFRMTEIKYPEDEKPGYIVGQERDISLKPDIYSMAIVVCQTDEVLKDGLKQKDIPAQYAPSDEQKSEIWITACVCFASQLLISTMLLSYFRTLEQSVIVDQWKQMVRLICAILFHITFEQELRYSISNMKYIAYHSDRFQSKWTAFIMCILQGSIVLVIEVVNIWNLTNIQQIDEIVMDYIALGIISEFDDCFFELYANTQLAKLTEDGTFHVMRFRKPKRKFAELNDKLTFVQMEEQVKKLASEGIGNMMMAAKKQSQMEKKVDVNLGDEEEKDKNLEQYQEENMRMSIVNQQKQAPTNDIFALKKSMSALATDIEANKFSEMNCTDKMFVIIFKLFRFVFITIYYYVFPYAVILWSIGVSLYGPQAREASVNAILEFEGLLPEE